MSSEPEHNRQLYIETVGCQMNMLDSELVVAALRRDGYQLTDNPKEADTILFNTCSVRDAAEQKAIGKAGYLQQRKKRQPDFVLGILGCMAQNRGASLLEQLPDVDLIIGTLSKSLASCGGYICARKEVIEWFRYTLPGFVYSVGFSPGTNRSAHPSTASGSQCLKNGTVTRGQNWSSKIVFFCGVPEWNTRPSSIATRKKYSRSSGSWKQRFSRA